MLGYPFQVHIGNVVSHFKDLASAMAHAGANRPSKVTADAGGEANFPEGDGEPVSTIPTQLEVAAEQVISEAKTETETEAQKTYEYEKEIAPKLAALVRQPSVTIAKDGMYDSDSVLAIVTKLREDIATLIENFKPDGEAQAPTP
jgi:hypothetical protein